MKRHRFRQEATPDVVLLSKWFSRTWIRFCRPGDRLRYQEQPDASAELPLQEIADGSVPLQEIADGSGSDDENDWTEEAYEKEMFLKRESERQRLRLRRLLQLLLLACVIAVCVVVATGAFVVAHFASDCRIPPFQNRELLQLPLLPTMYVSTTGAVVLRTHAAASNNSASFQMHHFSTTADRLVKAVSFENSSRTSLSVSESGDLDSTILGGYLCSGSNVEVLLSALTPLSLLSLSSLIYGSVDVDLSQDSLLIPYVDTVEIVSVQGARVHAVNSSAIVIRNGVGSVYVQRLDFMILASNLSLSSR
jgi:hypothetical protein